jgi:hypothetical protein
LILEDVGERDLLKSKEDNQINTGLLFGVIEKTLVSRMDRHMREDVPAGSVEDGAAPQLDVAQLVDLMPGKLHKGISVH